MRTKRASPDVKTAPVHPSSSVIVRSLDCSELGSSSLVVLRVTALKRRGLSLGITRPVLPFCP